MLEIINRYIEESGLKKNFIANRLKITRISLFNKLSGKVRFNWYELAMLNELLKFDKEDWDLIVSESKKEWKK